MSFLSDALNTLKKGLKEVEDKVNEAVQASKENEKVSGEKPAGAVIGGGVPSGTIIGGGSAVPAGEYHERSWYEEVPSEECQYNFGGSYLDYFTKIFREDFPEYDVGLETVESGRRYKYTLRKAGDVSLVVKPKLLAAFPNRVLNIHPALLPAFPGVHSWTQALDYGCKVAGVTVHFVDAGTDSGPIIVQKAVPVLEDDTPESLHARIQVQEHIAFPEALNILASGKYRVEGRRVRIG